MFLQRGRARASAAAAAQEGDWSLVILGPIGQRGDGAFMGAMEPLEGLEWVRDLLCPGLV